ncbi:MAG: hypothetical protein ACJ8F1_13025 [Polyangia bacterium]
MSVPVRHVVAMAVSIGAAAVLYAAPARADGDGWLAYQAPAGCPGRAEFLDAVGARGARLPGPTASRTLEISIRQAADGFAGSFQIRERDAVSGQRELRAAACNDVTDGLAIVTAIALGASPSAPPSPAVVAPLPAAVPPSAPRPAQEDRLRKNADIFTGDVEVPAGTLRFQSLLTTTVTAGGVVGMIPSVVLPRYDLTLFRGNFATTPNALTYLVGPLLHVRVSYLGEGTFRSSDGYSTTARGFGFGMSGCRAPLYDTRGLTLLGCIEYSAGFMQLDTKNAAGMQTSSKSVALAAVGLELEATYSLASRFFVTAKLGGDFSFSKLSADRPDGTQIFQSQPFSAHGLLGIGTYFK